MIRLCTLTLLACLVSLGARAQGVADSARLADVQLFLETGAFSWQEDRIMQFGRPHLAFAFEQMPAVAELILQPAYPEAIEGMQLLPSPGIAILDSLILLDGTAFRTRLRFTALTQADLPALTVQLTLRQGDTINTLIPFFPYTQTRLLPAPEEHVLYIGEEKILPLQARLPANIRPQPLWEKTPEVAYRLTLVNGQPQLHLIPLVYGTHTLRLPYRTFRPRRDSTGAFVYDHLMQPFEITVKRGKIPFLDLGLEEVYLTSGARYAAREISFDQRLTLSVQRTYRLEDQERPGGKFIGELFVDEIQSNGKMLAQVRAYDFHARREGPLYLKAGDEALFVTNFAVIPAPQIQEVYIRRGSGDWTQELTIQPGDSFDLRLTGQSLHRLALGLEGFAPADTQQAASQFLARGFYLPYTHRTREVVITANGQPTPHRLRVVEHARPRPLDFISLHVQEDTLSLLQMRSPHRVYGELVPCRLAFDRDKIDKAGDLYGLQHLEITASVWDAEGRRIELGSPQRLTIAPGQASPRHGRYGAESVWEGDLALKDLLKTPLAELPGWAQIRLTVAHQAGRYQEPGQRREVELVLARKVHFAMEVAFPMAVVSNGLGDNGTEVLSSLNLGAFLQIGLYRPGLIREASPLRLHVGAFATDVVRFRGEGVRDLGVATFLSVLPLESNRRWNIPLYLGGGYLFQTRRAFFFLGPGVSLVF